MGITMLCHVDTVSYKEKPKDQAQSVQYRLKNPVKYKTSDFFAHDVDEVIKALENGQTIALANCEDRKKDKFKAANSAALDFDNGHSSKFEKSDPAGRAAIVKAAIKTGGIISKQEVIDRCREKGFAAPTFIYSTFSAGQYIQDCLALAEQGLITDEDFERVKSTSTFRAVWVFDHTVNDPAIYTDVCEKRLRGIFPESDPDFKIEGILFGTRYTDTIRSDGALLDITTIPRPEPPPHPEPQPIALDPPAPAPARTAAPAVSATTQAESQRRNIEVYLRFLNPSMLSDAEWINVANAMKTEGFSFSDFDNWCRLDMSRYDEKQNLKRFNSLEIGMNTGGTINHYATTYGHMTDEAFRAKLAELYPPKNIKPKHPPAPTDEAAAGAAADQEKKAKTPLIVPTFEKFCREAGFRFRYDIITRTISYHGFSTADDTERLPNNAPTILQGILTGKNFSKATTENITNCIHVVAERNRYNPVLELLDTVKWDGHDYINDFYNLLQIDEEDQLSRVLILKWLKQSYCALHNDPRDPFSIDLVLVLNGSQGIGKTRLLEALALKRKFFGEGATLDPNDKDSVMQCTAVWLCELGELGSTMKKDRDKIKSFLSQAYTEFRPPYGRATERHPRRTSFCATVNDDEFLVDETGSRRWAVIPLKHSLRLDYTTQIAKFDFMQLWANVIALVTEDLAGGKTYANCFRLTPDEQGQLTTRNTKFTKKPKGLEEVRDVINDKRYSVPKNHICVTKPLTVTMFIEENPILKKYTAAQVGKCLQFLGYTQDRTSHTKNYTLPTWEYIESQN